MSGFHSCRTGVLGGEIQPKPDRKCQVEQDGCSLSSWPAEPQARIPTVGTGLGKEEAAEKKLSHLKPQEGTDWVQTGRLP